MSMRGINLSELAVKHRAVTLFLLIAILVAGVFAFGKLGRAEDPSFTVKVMTITAAWPGATAQEMQEQVADRLEKRLQELDYYDRVETIAQPGFVSMRMTFLESTRPSEIQALFYQTRKKLSDEAAQLPKGVIGPFFNDEYSDVYFALYALEAEHLPHRQQVQMAEQLRQGLLNLPGVKKVNILGEQAQRVFVEFSYERLATLGIKPEQIFAALAAQNAVAPSGFVETAGARAYIRIDGAFDSLALIENVPLQVNGRVLRIADVATVSRGYEDPPSYRIRHQGDPALMLGVIMEKHWNGLELDKSLQAEEARIQADLPLGVNFAKVPGTLSPACAILRASWGNSNNCRTASASPSASSTSRNAPASRIIAVMSRKLKTCGPMITGLPSAAGSSGLWPPVGTRLPPTNALSARA